MLIKVPTLIIPCMEDRAKIGKYAAENGLAKGLLGTYQCLKHQ